MKELSLTFLFFLLWSCGSVELPRLKPPTKEIAMKDAYPDYVKRGKIDRLVRALKADPGQIFSVDNKGMTLLHHSAMRNRYELVEALINAGAPVNAVDKNGDTPLHLAAYSTNTESVLLLTQAGADVNIKNSKGETSAHKAAYACKEDIFNALAVKADFEIEDLQKNRPLHIACKYQNLYFVQRLLQKKVEINILNIDGDDPLMMALKGLNSNQMLETLLISKVDNPKFRNKKQETYIHAAATNGKAHAIKLLLEKGALVNPKDVSGVTPIVRALRHKKREAAETLILSGADLRAVDKDGRTLLHMMAFWLNEKSMLDRFLKVIDINSVDGKGRSALHEIAYWGHIVNANEMIDAGAKVNLQAKNGETPLFDAIKSNNYAMTELLLKRGTNPNLKNSTGDTALKNAIKAEEPQLKIITLLLELGSDPNLKNVYGETSVHEAVRMGNPAVVRILKNYKPDLSAKDKFGKTPIEWAQDRKRTEILKLLQN